MPVPRAEVVRDADAAVVAAKRIGYPVAMKPLDGNHGRGVMLNLADEDAVRAAYPASRGQSRTGAIVVETYLTGNDYRCLVIDGVLRAVAQRLPAHVEGDGEHTLAELVEITNADPRRGIGHEKVLTRIKVDDEAVAYAREQGFELTDAPPRGQRVYLKRTGNMSTGGISIDRTEEAHPDNVELAELAARVVGLDIAGIDLICPDVSLPVRETGGGIVEVNAAPGFRMHTNPTEGEPQYVAKPVIDMLFPPGAPSRIPIVAVTGSNGKTTTARMISHIMKGMGRKVGLTSTDGIYVDGRIVRRADSSGPKSASMVLQNPTVDFAVFEVARGGILREGLGYHRNDVAVVLNVTGDHLGLGGIHSIRQLAEVKRVVVEAVPRDGVAVLNADDPLVAAMARHCSGSVVYFSTDPEHERLKFQAARGPAGGHARAGPQRRDDRAAPGPQVDVPGLDPPHPGHLRGPRADERPERPGRHRGLVGRRRAPPRHPPGVADVRDQLLHGAGTDEHVRARRLPGRRRLRPQPAGPACRGRLRRAPHRALARRRARSGHRPAHRRHRHGRRSPRRRHPSRWAGSRPASSTRSSSARTRTTAGGPGETPPR